jgi:hypothetical protein
VDIGFRGWSIAWLRKTFKSLLRSIADLKDMASFLQSGSYDEKKAYAQAVLDDQAVCQAFESLACARLKGNVKAEVKRVFRGLLSKNALKKDLLGKHEFGSAAGVVAYIGRRQEKAAEKAASAKAAEAAEITDDDLEDELENQPAAAGGVLVEDDEEIVVHGSVAVGVQVTSNHTHAHTHAQLMLNIHASRSSARSTLVPCRRTSTVGHHLMISRHSVVGLRCVLERSGVELRVCTHRFRRPRANRITWPRMRADRVRDRLLCHRQRRRRQRRQR